MKGQWTCQRRKAGVRCGHVNANRYRNCRACGKARPARRRPAHMSALALPYEYYVEINGSERCGICGTESKPGKRLHRDHEHKGVGKARGLLCFRCNAALRPYMDIDWLRAAVSYVERTA